MTAILGCASRMPSVFDGFVQAANGPLHLIVGGFEVDAMAKTINQPPQPHSAVDQLTVTLPVVSMEAAATRRARGIM